MNARKVLEIMVRTDRGNMTVFSPDQVRNALDAYRAEVLREAEEHVRTAAASWEQVEAAGDSGQFKVIAAHALLIADDLRRLADEAVRA